MFKECSHLDPMETGNEEECTPNECEDQIPALNDILKSSFASVCTIFRHQSACLHLTLLFL